MPENMSDEAEREKALDHTRSFIVQAPAGSGKTELLVQRFLTLLAKVDRPESIVAITFTRKAAAEMRQRVIEALRRAPGPEPGEPHERRTWTLARTVAAQNEKLGWCLEEHPARLRIQTIDSLCAVLVRHRPLVSRLGAPREPHERPWHLYQTAARRTVALLGADQAPPETSAAIARLLSHLDNNVATFVRLLGGMLGKRDQWQRYVNGDGASPVPREELESGLKEIVVSALQRLEAAFPLDNRSEIVSLARYAAKYLRQTKPDHPVAACFEIGEFPNAAISSLPVWLGIAELFVKKQGGALSRIDVRWGFPKDDNGEKSRWEQVELRPDLIELLHEVRKLPPIRFENEHWDVLAALTHVLPVAVGQLRQVFREEGCVDFAEIAIAARRATRPGNVRANRAGILGHDIAHLLIDEFQDTSQTQFEILTRLVADWHPADGRTVFAVGDPMQSIYGFREAEVSLFLQGRKVGLGPVRLEPLSLSTNFRSTATVVQWINDALSQAFPQTEDALTGAVTYEHSVASKGADPVGGVRVHPFFSDGQQLEAERVQEIIEDLQSRKPGESIAVLVLARTHLPGIVMALRKAGKRFRAVEIDSLRDSSVVRDLMSLTLALMHLGNRVAWLSILRAPWCGLTLKDLEALVGGNSTVTIWDQLEDSACQARLSPDGRARIGRVIPVLRHALAQRGRLPVRRWVESTWIALAGPESLNDRNELEDAAAYLDLLERSLDGADLRDESQFVEDVSNLFASGDDGADDGLQLMTIHKAKGLEFDTVILPGLGRTPKSPDSPLLLWREFMVGERARLVLAPIKETGGRDDAIYAYLKSIEKARRRNEATRLLYVAATRARKNLHLLGHVLIDEKKGKPKRPGAASLLAKLWKTVEPGFVDALEVATEQGGQAHEGESRPIGVPVRRIALDWIPEELPHDATWQARVHARDPDVAETLVKYGWVNDLHRRVGLVVHRMLQQLQAPDRLGFSDGTLHGALRCEGLHGAALDEAVTRARTALENSTTDERGRWILACHEHDEREYALSTLVQGSITRMIVDRTFVDAGKRWIIDYKTGMHTGGDRDGFLDDEQSRYQAQLENYARAVQHLDSRPIHLGLYFPMLKGWREWRFSGD